MTMSVIKKLPKKDYTTLVLILGMQLSFDY
jgi:hypothetical protein